MGAGPFPSCIRFYYVLPHRSWSNLQSLSILGTVEQGVQIHRNWSKLRDSLHLLGEINLTCGNYGRQHHWPTSQIDHLHQRCHLRSSHWPHLRRRHHSQYPSYLWIIVRRSHKKSYIRLPQSQSKRVKDEGENSPPTELSQPILLCLSR